MEQNFKKRRKKNVKKYKKSKVFAVVFLTLAIIFCSIFAYFLFNKSSKNPKLDECFLVKKINKEYDEKRKNLKGQEAELDLLAKYVLINLFTLKGTNESTLKRLNELVDEQYQNEFNKQVKQNILFKTDFFKDSYKEINFPEVKNVILKNKEEVEDIILNDKRMPQYKLQCVLEYEENTINKSSNDILLQKNLLQKWPYELKIYFYWDKIKSNWQVSKLLDITTNEEKETKMKLDTQKNKKETNNKENKKEKDGKTNN